MISITGRNRMGQTAVSHIAQKTWLVLRKSPLKVSSQHTVKQDHHQSEVTRVAVGIERWLMIDTRSGLIQ